MSLKIIKPGIQDTIQDMGRYGFQHLGINPGGAMDLVAMQIANALVSNKMNEAVLEMHFPAAEILFDADSVIAISGADFSPAIYGSPVSINHPIIVQKNATLKFLKNVKGARCYLSIHGGYEIEEWLGSKSTNTKIGKGGFRGRALQKNDVLPFKTIADLLKHNINNGFSQLPWLANTKEFYTNNEINFLPGEAFEALNNGDKEKLLNNDLSVSSKSDRMAYYLEGVKLDASKFKERISSAVTRGTIQLLPDGQMIVLMADHQTTGGYPVVGCVTTSSFPSLAQMRAREKFKFHITDIKNAEDNLLNQHSNLLQLQNACNFRLQNFLKY